MNLPRNIPLISYYEPATKYTFDFLNPLSGMHQTKGGGAEKEEFLAGIP